MGMWHPTRVVPIYWAGIQCTSSRKLVFINWCLDAVISEKPAKKIWHTRIGPSEFLHGNRVHSHHRNRHVFVCHNSLTVFTLQIKFSKNSHLYLFYFHLRSSIATLNNVEKLAVGTPVSCLTVAIIFQLWVNLQSCKTQWPCLVAFCRLFHSTYRPRRESQCQKHWHACSVAHRLAENDTSTLLQLVTSINPGLSYFCLLSLVNLITIYF